MRLAVCCAIIVASSQAAIYTFNNNVPPPFYWLNSANWIPAGVPGAADTAIVANVRNVECVVNADVGVMNLTLINAEVKFLVTHNSPTITFGNIMAVSGSRLEVDALVYVKVAITITSTLAISDSALFVSGVEEGDFSGAVLSAAGNSIITLASNGFIKGFKGPIRFPPSAMLMCLDMPKGLTWNGQLAGSLDRCALVDSAITAVGNVQLTSVILNNTQLAAAGFRVTVLPPEDETRHTHLTDGSSITADDLVFSYPYNLTTPSLDTYLNCDADCKASVFVQNMTLDGYQNLGYNVKIAVCLTVANAVRISDNLYNNLTYATPYIHFARGAAIANIVPLQAGDRSYTVVIGGEFRRFANMCQRAGSFVMKDQSGRLNLQLQEDAVLDNVDLKGQLTISNTIAKTPANVVVKNGGGVDNLKLGHGTLTLDATTANYQIGDSVQIEHPADYQMKASVLSIATITSHNPSLTLNPPNGFILNAPLSMNDVQSQMKVVFNVSVRTIDGDPNLLKIQNSHMKVDVIFTQPGGSLLEIQALKMWGSSINTVDFSLTAGPQTIIDASALKLTSDGFSPNSTSTLNLGNGSVYTPTEWRTPSLTLNGLLSVRGDRVDSVMLESVTANTAGNQMPELTTEAALFVVRNFTVNAPTARWAARSVIRMNGHIQGQGILTVDGVHSPGLERVFLEDGPLRNLVLSGVNFTQYTNPTTVSGTVKFINSTYVNDTIFGSELATSFVLDTGASWQLTGLTHPADFSVSIRDPGDCLYGEVGGTAVKCVANSTIPKNVMSSEINSTAANGFCMVRFVNAAINETLPITVTAEHLPRSYQMNFTQNPLPAESFPCPANGQVRYSVVFGDGAEINDVVSDVVAGVVSYVVIFSKTHYTVRSSREENGTLSFPIINPCPYSVRASYNNGTARVIDFEPTDVSIVRLASRKVTIQGVVHDLSPIDDIFVFNATTVVVGSEGALPIPKCIDSTPDNCDCDYWLLIDRSQDSSMEHNEEFVEDLLLKMRGSNLITLVMYSETFEEFPATWNKAEILDHVRRSDRSTGTSQSTAALAALRAATAAESAAACTRVVLFSTTGLFDCGDCDTGYTLHVRPATRVLVSAVPNPNWSNLKGASVIVQTSRDFDILDNATSVFINECQRTCNGIKYNTVVDRCIGSVYCSKGFCYSHPLTDGSPCGDDGSCEDGICTWRHVPSPQLLLPPSMQSYWGNTCCVVISLAAQGPQLRQFSLVALTATRGAQLGEYHFMVDNGNTSVWIDFPSVKLASGDTVFLTSNITEFKFLFPRSSALVNLELPYLAGGEKLVLVRKAETLYYRFDTRVQPTAGEVWSLTPAGGWVDSSRRRISSLPSFDLVHVNATCYCIPLEADVDDNGVAKCFSLGVTTASATLATSDLSFSFGSQFVYTAPGSVIGLNKWNCTIV